MKILVTGGCGFIGANFIHLLFEQEYPSLVLNLDKLTYAGNPENLSSIARQHEGQKYILVQGDINDRELIINLIQKHEIEAIVHFAAESHVDRSINDPAPFMTTNINGTQNLLEAARQTRLQRFVHVSTDEVYGSLGETGKFTESTPLAPNSPYSASKASSDLLARAYFETYDLPVLITRCSNNYGPYQFPEKLIPLMLEQALADKPLPIYGNGLNVRDWIYVRDHCQGVLRVLQAGKEGEVYNFGGNAERTNLQVVKNILKLTGKPESLISFVQDRPGHDLRYAMDSSKALAELNWQPSVDFEQGLQQTIEWYKNNQDWLNNVKSGTYRKFMDSWYAQR